MTNEERASKKREYIKEWRKKNPEKVKEQLRRYELKHREQRLAYKRTQYKLMREKAAKYDELMKGEKEE